MNVYYFPDRSHKNLSPTITPVNSFRLIFSRYFGLNYPPLPDRSYFSNCKASYYKYYDVTSLVRDGKLRNWAK